MTRHRRIHMRGRHQSSCKAGQKTLLAIRQIPGVKAVIIGRSWGGKSFHQAYDGAVKLQQTSQGAIQGLMRTSKGIQHISILLESPEFEDQIRHVIESNF